MLYHEACLEAEGANCLNFCFSFQFPSHILRQSLYISALALSVVVVAVRVWAVILHGRRFVIRDLKIRGRRRQRKRR